MGIYTTYGKTRQIFMITIHYYHGNLDKYKKFHEHAEITLYCTRCLYKHCVVSKFLLSSPINFDIKMYATGTIFAFIIVVRHNFLSSCRCRRINRLLIILQKDLYYKSSLLIYMTFILIIYIYIYIDPPNFLNVKVYHCIHAHVHIVSAVWLVPCIHA